MRRFHPFWIYLGILSVLFSCSKNRIINQPDYESYQTQSLLGIEKIELTDTASIIYVSLYCLPGYWVALSHDMKLTGRQSGKDYSLKWIEGLAPDIMIHVDSTGYISAKLLFEPIGDQDKEIDFFEESDYIIRGIKLYDDSQERIKTNISGTLNSMGSSCLILEKTNVRGKDLRYIVPVREGKFSYDIYTDYPFLFKVYIGKEYQEGIIEDSPQFWSEGGNIRLEFPSGSSDGFFIEGGPLTKELKDYKNREAEFFKDFQDSIPELKNYYELKENKTLYKPEYYLLKNMLRSSKIGRERVKLNKRIIQLSSNEDSLYSEEGKKVMLSYYKFVEENQEFMKEKRWEFYEKELSHPSLTHLSELFQNVKLYNKELEKSINIFYRNYSDTLREHPYHEILQEISDLSAPVVGNHFINVFLEDKEGELQNLSYLIEGKTALLYFYDPKSDSCLNTITKFLPLYNKYKNEGFEIVGITREDKCNNGLVNDENISWKTLKDKSDESTWRKYRMGEESEKILLIDKDGIIREINPNIVIIETFIRSQKGFKD